MFVGRHESIHTHTQKLEWQSKENCLSYTTAVGRNLLQTKNPHSKTIFDEWHGSLIPSLKLKWGNVW